MEKISILMVCTGNICRSPTADGVLRKKIAQAGLVGRVRVDSAGTTDYHVGEAPDRRAQQHAKKRGYDLSNLRAREVCASDYVEFDLILAMDSTHLSFLKRSCPSEYQTKVQLFLDFAPEYRQSDVPDPYYGGAEGFEQVLNLIEAGCDGVMKLVQLQLCAQSR